MASLDTFPPRRNDGGGFFTPHPPSSEAAWTTPLSAAEFAAILTGNDVYSDDEAYESDISYDDERPDLFWVSRIIMYDEQPPSSDVHPPQTSF